MSGIACVVVASGNRSQAAAQTFKSASQTGVMPLADDAIAVAQTLCTFAGTYDPVATPSQQTQATVIMDRFIAAAAVIPVRGKFRPQEEAAALATLDTFVIEGNALINQILANP